MSACLEAAPPLAPSPPTTDPRAARLKTFQREQLIVDYLNRGVSVAEIAARVGFGEKRMRAVIREILARRMPAPPEEFVAIQVSRLNEALLVAFSAMTDANLKAVDRVVRIVRELDRYHGFVAARAAVPSRRALEAPARLARRSSAARKLRCKTLKRLDSRPALTLASSAGRRARASRTRVAARHVIARSPQGDVAIQGPSDALRSAWIATLRSR